MKVLKRFKPFKDFFFFISVERNYSNLRFLTTDILLMLLAGIIIQTMQTANAHTSIKMICNTLISIGTLVR